MKDIHSERSSPGRITIISPAIHCIAMTALVFLRSSFGYAFLRPKSIFFALSWAFLILSYIGWHEPSLWQEYRVVLLFGCTAIFLYWLHLIVAVSREFYRSGQHDHYSGTSHLLRFSRAGSKPREFTIHLLIEPGLLLLAAGILRLIFGEHHLSLWFVFTAGAMACKEGINYWAAVRREKIKKDMVSDAEEQGESLSMNQPAAAPPKATRQEPVKQPRNTAAAEERARETLYGEVLRLRPPYTLKKAEENYLTLIRLEHPDANDQSAESNARAAELNEAIEYFRLHHW